MPACPCRSVGRISTGAVLVAIVLLILGACAHGGGGQVGGVPPSVSTSGFSPATDATPALSDDYRRARLAEALVGLVYDDDGVSVDPAVANPFQDTAVAQSAVDEGHVLMATGYHVDAIAAFTRAVIAAPDLVGAYRGLATALVTKGQTSKARAALQTAIALDATNDHSHYLLGTVHERLGDLPRAMEAYETAVALAPGHGRAHARLAALRHLTGDTDRAVAHLASARAVGADVPRQLPGLLAGVPQPTVVVKALIPGGSPGPVIGPPTRIDTGAGTAQSNETTGAAASPAPGVVVAGWNDYRTPIRNGFGVTLDGGITWTDFVVRPPVPNQGDTEGDPMAAFDPRTGTLWVGGVSFTGAGGIFVARKQAGAATFEPAVMTQVSGAADKVWMAAGRPPATPDATNLYVAYNLGLQRSTDLGDTWGGTVSLGSGIGFLPRVGPAGKVHVGFWDFGAGVRLRTSLDGGGTVGPSVLAASRMVIYDTFATPHLPGQFRAPPLNYLAIDPTTGRLYFVWFDTTSVSGGESEVDLYLIQSDDGGATWTVPAVFALPGDQFMPWLEVDETGRLHLLYLDTRNTVQNDSDSTAFLDAYYAYSEDAGATWTEARLTPTSWSSALANGGGTFIGDYLGMGVAANQVYPIYISTQGGTDLDVFTNVITFPTNVVFADGFESGDTSAWNVAVP